MSRIRRIIFGEPETKKQWTVWYYDWFGGNCHKSTTHN